jgi:Transposase DDE domain
VGGAVRLASCVVPDVWPDGDVLLLTRLRRRASCVRVLHGSGSRLRLVVEAWWAQDDPIHHRKPVAPFKHHAEHRHHIPKPRHRVTNWPEYDAALRRRGSLTVWITDEAIAAWRAEPRTTPGGQPYYSALAITMALTMRAVFSLALRQTEGLIGSVIALLGLALTVPDHSTMSRRSRTLELPPLRRSAQ